MRGMFRSLRRAFVASLAALACLASAASSDTSTATAGAIAARVRDLAQGRLGTIAGEPLRSAATLARLYPAEATAPLWSDPARVASMRAAIDSSATHGLTPDDYHRQTIDALRPRAGADPEAAADLDLLLTDAVLRLGEHLHFGKADPERLDPDWNLSRTIDGLDPAAWCRRAITGPDVAAALSAVAPADPYYGRLRRTLAVYRALADAGGWAAIPAGPTLRPGDVDARVPAIRRRLALTGDLDGAPAADSLRLDDTLVAAVRRFQYRAGQREDGIVGPATRAAMSKPVTHRVDQIRVDLERARWVLHDMPDTLVLVNVSSAEVYVREQGRIAWRARCMVGQPGRRTPVFADSIRYLEFNPTWTVPRGILAKDILPAGKRGEDILGRKHLKAYDASGRLVPASSIAWSKYTAGTFPYTLRQDPGPENALGRVKFMFPNRHSVYLHDTPSRDLFEHDRRTFSSGCVRVERPLELAERLLADPARWDAAAIRRVVDSQKQTRVNLARPMPIRILYWTVNVDEQGLARFSDDVYRRDAAVLQELDAPFRPRKRPLATPPGR